MMKLVLALAIVTVFLMSGSISAKQLSALETNVEGLVEIDKSKMDEAWVRPGFDPSSYSKIMFIGSDVQYRPGKLRSSIRGSLQDNFEISMRKKERLEQTIATIFAAELAGIEGYQVVQEADVDTLLVEIELLDVVSKVPPERAGRVDVYLSEVGAATLVITFIDTATGATMFKGADRRAAETYGPGDLELSSPVNNLQKVKLLARIWAKGLRKGVESMRAAGPANP